MAVMIDSNIVTKVGAKGIFKADPQADRKPWAMRASSFIQKYAVSEKQIGLITAIKNTDLPSSERINAVDEAFKEQIMHGAEPTVFGRMLAAACAEAYLSDGPEQITEAMKHAIIALSNCFENNGVGIIPWQVFVKRNGQTVVPQ